MSPLEQPGAQKREWIGQHRELASIGTSTNLAIYYFLWLKVNTLKTQRVWTCLRELQEKRLHQSVLIP